MNARTAMLAFAVVLIGVGGIMTLKDLLSPTPPPPKVMVARAVQQIEPYTVVTQDMIQTEQMSARTARDSNAWKVEQVAGMMATDLLAPGDVMTAGNVQPIEQYRGWKDLGMELVSFTSSVDRLVAGQLRPGMLINIYGFNRGRPDETFTKLIEENVRVVRVLQGSGRAAGQGTPVADWQDNQVTYGDDKGRSGTLLTVALPPERAFNLIDALGAQALQPYVTMAGNRTVSALATPRYLETPEQAAPIDWAATMTAIAIISNATELSPPITGGGGASR